LGGLDEELDEIRKRKLEELKRRYLVGSESRTTPVELTAENFEPAIRRNRIVVVDLWAEWCPPCRMMEPVIEELARDYAGKVLFGKLNVDENAEIAVKYSVSGIPTFLFFNNGKLVDRVTGAVPRRYIEQKINSLLASGEVNR